MSIAIAIATLIGFLAGLLPMLALKRRTAKQTETAIEAIDAAAWHDGFNRGWKAASNDFTNVRTSWERLTKSD